jgi:hypothetical protein
MKMTTEGKKEERSPIITQWRKVLLKRKKKAILEIKLIFHRIRSTALLALSICKPIYPSALLSFGAINSSFFPCFTHYSTTLSQDNTNQKKKPTN